MQQTYGLTLILSVALADCSLNYILINLYDSVLGYV